MYTIATHWPTWEKVVALRSAQDRVALVVVSKLRVSIMTDTTFRWQLLLIKARNVLNNELYCSEGICEKRRIAKQLNG